MRVNRVKRMLAEVELPWARWSSNLRAVASGEEADEDDPESPVDGPQVIVDGGSMSWTEFEELLKPYVGWSFELRLGTEPSSRAHGDTLDSIYVLDSAHYPTPD